MFLRDQLFEYLAGRDIRFDDDESARAAGLTDEAVEALIAEWQSNQLKNRNELSDFQIQKIREGRVDELVFGDYVLRKWLGAGGQATVYAAYHCGMERVDAIKAIKSDALDDLIGQDFARFQQGVRAAAQLNHDNIVRTYGYDRRRHFVFMEYVNGPSLERLVGALSEAVAVKYLLHAARGLEHAHNRPDPIIHRDIKPGNLLLEKDIDTVKITDWGLARIVKKGGSATTRLTQAGQVFGSVCFMSPEQGTDAAETDERSDIYSFGCTLFTVLTGKPMYERKTATLTILDHCSAPIPSMRDFVEVSDRVDEIYQKMVAKDPDERYQTIGEVVAALEEVVGD